MKEANLIDIFGLSGDPASDDQVDALLARLELEEATNLLDANPEKITCKVFSIPGNRPRLKF